MHGNGSRCNGGLQPWHQVMALFPLFPGQNEMDQLQKIHGILGTPNEELLRKFKLNSDVAFPEKKGTGIDHLIPHASLDVLSVLKKLLRYDPEERITARHGLLSPYFEEVPERTENTTRHRETESGNTNSQIPTSTFCTEQCFIFLNLWVSSSCLSRS